MKKGVVAILILGALWGCSVFTQSYKLGSEAEINKNWDEAVKLYERAALENPREPVYRLALLRAKMSAALLHVQRARASAAQGRKDEALAEYRTALVFDPTNRIIASEMAALISPPAALEKPADTPVTAPFKLDVGDEKIQLKFTDAALRSIFQTLGKSAGVNFLYDDQFRDVPLSVDMADRTFDQALSFLCLASKNFFRVIDAKTVIVVPDTPMKRLQYEINAIRTFYLSNLNAQDVQNSLNMMIRTQYKAPSIIIDKNLNSITVRDTPSAVNLAAKLLKAWDKSKGEVIIDLEIMEVSRIKEKKIGLDLGDTIFGMRSSQGGTVPADGWFDLNSLDFAKSANYQVSLPSAYLQLLKSDSDTKIIAQPRLRGLGSEAITYVVGQKVPVPQTTFTPIAAGGVSQQPVVSYEYQDVGINVKITPRIHAEGEVSLDLEIKITSIGGTGIADLPIITTREVKNTIRLKDGETNLLAGLLKDEERQSLSGIAGLKDIPLLGNLFSNTDSTIEQTDVILTITPYIIRTVPMTDEDAKPFWADVEGLSATAGESGTAGPEITAFRRELGGETGEVAETIEEAGGNRIALNPADFEVPRGREFRINVDMRSGADIGNIALNIGYPPATLSLKEVVEGDLVRRTGENVPFLKNIDNSSGTCAIGLSSPSIGKGIGGQGVLAVLVFEAVGPGEATVSVAGVSANGTRGRPVAFETSESRIVVR